MNVDRRNDKFPVHAFYKAKAQYVSAFRARLSEVRSHNQFLFASFGFDGFLDFEITFSNPSRTKNKILDVIANEMRLLRWDQGERVEQFEHGSLERQK